MATIRFNVKPTKTNMQIRALFQDGTKQYYKFTGYTIPSNKLKDGYKYWDKDKQIVKGNIENATAINALIAKWKYDFGAYIDECRRLERREDIPLFIKSLTGQAIVNASPFLLEVAKMFYKDIQSTHKNGTVRGYKVILNNIEKYEIKRSKKILLQEIDRTFYRDFSIYLIEEENNTNVTVNRKQSKIRTIINFGVNELKIKMPDTEHKLKHKFKEAQAGKFPLRPEELAALRNFVCNTDYKQMVLDSFLLACETGLRFSDIQQLQPAHIKAHITESRIIQYIDLMNIKGDHFNNMPLSNVAAAIIEKYMKPEGYLFEFDYSQSASKALKQIFADPKLNLNRPCEIITIQGAKTERTIVPLHDIISFHMGRNTYITRLLSSSIAPVHVQANAGHSDLKITMGYFRNDDVIRWDETLKVLDEKKPDVNTSSPS